MDYWGKDIYSWSIFSAEVYGYVQVLGKFWTALGRRRGVVRALQWFQQDGATPHTSNESLAWLRQRFPDRLISRRCDPEWSPHSPDLNPPDFYLWGYLKDRVFGNNPQTIPDLKAAITAAIKSDPEGGMREGHQELSPPDPSVPAAPGSSFGAHFRAPVKQRVFAVQTWNFKDVFYIGLT